MHAGLILTLVVVLVKSPPFPRSSRLPFAIVATLDDSTTVFLPGSNVDDAVGFPSTRSRRRLAMLAVAYDRSDYS